MRWFLTFLANYPFWCIWKHDYTQNCQKYAQKICQKICHKNLSKNLSKNLPKNLSKNLSKNMPKKSVKKLTKKLGKKSEYIKIYEPILVFSQTIITQFYVEIFKQMFLQIDSKYFKFSYLTMSLGSNPKIFPNSCDIHCSGNIILPKILIFFLKSWKDVETFCFERLRDDF